MHGHLEDRLGGFKGEEVLVEVTDRGVAAALNGTFRRRVFTYEHLEQGGFAGAVIADKADALLGMDVPGGVLHDRPRTEFKCYVLETCEHN
jgi:hypothetical protein